jgi:hypothetical protein
VSTGKPRPGREVKVLEISRKNNDRGPWLNSDVHTWLSFKCPSRVKAKSTSDEDSAGNRHATFFYSKGNHNIGRNKLDWHLTFCGLLAAP